MFVCVDVRECHLMCVPAQGMETPKVGPMTSELLLLLPTSPKQRESRIADSKLKNEDKTKTKGDEEHRREREREQGRRERPAEQCERKPESCSE